jgi:hypothetical protein
MTHLGLEQIRQGIGYYRLALILQLVATAVSGALLGFSAGGGEVVAGFDSSATPSPAVSGAIQTAVSGVTGLLGLVALIVIIFSWIRWREGAETLKTWAGEFGPGPAGIARRVRSDVTATAVTWIVLFVASIAAVVAIAAVVISSVFSSVNSTAGSSSTSDALTPALQGELVAILFVLVVLATGLTLLMYAFATRSHLDALASYATPLERLRAANARRIILLGAALGFLSLIGLFFSYTGILAAVPAALLVYGYVELTGTYDSVLARPVQPDPMARPAERLLF